MRRLLAIAIFLMVVSSAGAEHSDFNDSSDPVIGAENADLNIEIWCDFEGPYCKEFFDNTFPQIENEYIDHGEVKAEWIDRPIEGMHPWSKNAAVTMECVHREDNSAFWEVTDTIFQNQESLDNETVRDEIIDYAEEFDIEEENLRECISDNASDEVNSDIEEAENQNISATPTIIIGNQKIEGAQPYQEFETVIEAELEDSDSDRDRNLRDNEPKDAEDLEERLNESQENITPLQQELNQQEEEISELEEQQSTIINILDRLMDFLGI